MEYGTDKMEMHVGAVEAGERAVIVDDLIATGGTLNAAIRLLGMIHNLDWKCIIFLLYLNMVRKLLLGMFYELVLLYISN